MRLWYLGELLRFRIIDGAVSPVVGPTPLADNRELANLHLRYTEAFGERFANFLRKRACLLLSAVEVEVPLVEPTTVEPHGSSLLGAVLALKSALQTPRLCAAFG